MCKIYVFTIFYKLSYYIVAFQIYMQGATSYYFEIASLNFYKNCTYLL